MPPKKKATAKRVTKPSFKPTDDERLLVEQMSAVGIPQDSIARVVRTGIDPTTLRKHFRHELDTAATKANAKVGGKLFNKIMGGDTTAAIWWTKTRMGWKEKTEVESDVTLHITTGVPHNPAINGNS